MRIRRHLKLINLLDFSRLAVVIAICSLILLGVIYAGRAPRTFAAERHGIGLPWDWSHEHLIFGKAMDPKVSKLIERDPRLLHQNLRRHPPASTASLNNKDRGPSSFASLLSVDDTPGSAGPLQKQASHFGTPWSAVNLPRNVWVATAIFGISFVGVLWYGRRWRTPLLTMLFSAFLLVIASCNTVSKTSLLPAGSQSPTINQDWSATLGVTGFTGVGTSAPIYPAKYSFNVFTNPSCSDYVVFPTGSNGALSTNVVTPNGQASIVGFQNLYSTQPTAGGYCNTDGPTVAWAYINVVCNASPNQTSSDPILSSPALSIDGSKVAWVTSTGKVQILTIGSGGGSAFAPVCIDEDGSALQSVTLSNAQNSSPTVTYSSIYVDYVNDAGYVGDDNGYLHKIQPFFTATGALQEVAAPARLATHAYAVGNVVVDSNGFIEECTHAGTSGSGGAPSWSKTWGSTIADGTVTWTNEGSGGGWPVHVTGVSGKTDESILSSPIFDGASQNIIVGDLLGSLYYVMDPITSNIAGSCANSATLYPCLGAPGTTTGISNRGGNQADCSGASPHPTCLVMSNAQGFTDSVTVDGSNGLVLAQFSDADGIGAYLEQTNPSLSVYNQAPYIGQSSIASHTGAFDNNYFNNPATGYYYMCGPEGAITGLYRFNFTVTGSTVSLEDESGSPLPLTTSGASGNCSPVTEIYNSATSTDWIFLSVDANGVTPTCAGSSCVMAIILGGGSINYSYAGPASKNMGGTSGIVVDNVANTAAFPQASSIYFAPVANNLACGDGTSASSGCGIKLTQNGLN